MKLFAWIKVSLKRIPPGLPGGFLFLASCFALTACAMQFPEDGIPIKHAKTLSSTAIVALPVTPNERVIHLNVSGSASSTLTRMLQDEFEKKGYHIENNAKKANYVITIRILYQGLGNEDAVDDILLQGYDAPVWPAGAIAVGKERYIKTVGRSRAAYMMVVDLKLKDGQEVYQARLISYYPNWMGRAIEKNAYSEMNQSMTSYITSIF